MSSLYKTPIENLKGIGKKRAELFNRLNLYSVGDVLEFYPRKYENWTDITPIELAEDGQTVCIKGTIGNFINSVRTKGGKLLTKFSIFDDTGAIEVIYFNNKYIDSMLNYGETYLFYGKINRNVTGMQMVSPTFSKTEDSTGLHPIYKLTNGLNNRVITNAVESAIDMLPAVINDPLPQILRDKFKLCDYKFAIENIHFPKSTKDLQQAQKRLICQELLILMLGMGKLKSNSKVQTKLNLKEDYTKDFLNLLPYKLTNAQLKAISDCIDDMMNKPTSMNRLVQGDVGSGKTAVASAVCYNAVKNGWQSAFMAPTEILAEQHYQGLKELFKDENINIDLLTGSLTPSQKKTVRERIASGETDIVIGTHTLITDKTEFKNLGVAITDEQHRFGVAQRAKLLSKGDNPHLLVMSATPIPRTLGLIIYGDLDISIIDELPPGRQKVDTMLINSTIRYRACNFIKEQVKNGNQAYIVCPLVTEGETDLASAEEYAAELMLKEFSDIAVGVLHGKMKSSEKEQVMSAFEKGDISVLVSTTVIEVGVNVPNATVMMIENAEMFGLSQLHQLRGRVGRGKDKSYCILVSDNRNPETINRLKTLCKTNNGFEIADADLLQRGPGDFFGERQHGLPQLAIADFADTENLATAKEMCNFIYANHTNISLNEQKTLNACVKRLFNKGGLNIMN